METTREVEVMREATSCWPVRSGIRGRIDSLKSGAVSRVHDLKRNVGDSRVAVRDGARNQVTRVQTSMRSNPMMWAGIATGTGFALGLMGRIAQWRNKQKYAMPEIVIIEATC